MVWNIRKDMTRPGQGYLDRSAGKVVYWPLPNEDMDKATVLAGVTERIIHIEGASGITISGLQLSDSRKSTSAAPGPDKPTVQVKDSAAIADRRYGSTVATRLFTVDRRLRLC